MCYTNALRPKGSQSGLLLSQATCSSALARLVMRESDRARERGREHAREREREKEREKDILVWTQESAAHIFAVALRVREV